MLHLHLLSVKLNFAASQLTNVNELVASQLELDPDPGLVDSPPMMVLLQMAIVDPRHELQRTECTLLIQILHSLQGTQQGVNIARNHPVDGLRTLESIVPY